MKPGARLVIPFWGARHAERMARIALPALLAPGNLPALAERFECELAFVTQAHLFESTAARPIVRAAAKICRLQFIAMDDALLHPGHYGYTLTHALHRSVASLGEAAKDTWFFFVNTDFAIADGSYRALLRRIAGGAHALLAPSYCAIEEEILPVLERRCAADGTLAVAPRELAGLALDHRHFTVRAKTVNRSGARAERTDQFYYEVDADTLLGRQLPICVVALRPTRVPAQPVTFWDYGVLSELCPGERPGVLADSDEFMMLEARGGNERRSEGPSGEIDIARVARDLSLWTTRDQRACGEHTLVLHRSDLPASLEQGRAALDSFYRSVMDRVVPAPRDHRGHYLWEGTLAIQREWLAARRRLLGVDLQAPGDLTTSVADRTSRTGDGEGNLPRIVHDLLREIYVRLIGRPPVVGPLNPLWGDLRPAIAAIEAACTVATSALAVWSSADASVAINLPRWVGSVDHAGLSELGGVTQTYDLCVAELLPAELPILADHLPSLTRLLRPGGRLIVFARARGGAPLDAKMLAAAVSNDLARRARMTIDYRGGPMQAHLRSVWEARLRSAAQRGVGALAGIAAFTAFAGVFCALASVVVGVRRTADNGCSSLLLSLWNNR